MQLVNSKAFRRASKASYILLTCLTLFLYSSLSWAPFVYYEGGEEGSESGGDVPGTMTYQEHGLVKEGDKAVRVAVSVDGSYYLKWVKISQTCQSGSSSKTNNTDITSKRWGRWLVKAGCDIKVSGKTSSGKTRSVSWSNLNQSVCVAWRQNWFNSTISKRGTFC